MRELWPILLPIALGGMAVFLLLPQPGQRSRLVGGLLAGAALLLAGVLWIRTSGLHAESVLFYAFSAIAVIAGGIMITQSNPARAALAFALVVLAVCGLFLLQAAPFLMAATIIIYAGAIIVTFLFVLMLAQQEGPSNANDRSREPHLATAAGAVLLFTLLFVLLRTYDTSALDKLLARAERARNQPTAAEMAQALDDDKFFEHLMEALARAPGGRSMTAASDQVMELQEEWARAKQQADPAAGLKKVLDGVIALGQEARGNWADLPPDPRLPLSTGSVPSGLQAPPHDGAGRAALPAENVAFLGRSLFSDYLMAVELAGVLLTVATIGAIVIAARRRRPEEGAIS